jgi:NAD(P)-dependent dehydrogenase (short-subunit alcohol dehydrogenase family)
VAKEFVMSELTSQKRVALVTGASSGIGAAIAQRLVADGYRVFGTARKPVAATHRGFELVELDVSSDASVERCIATVIERAGAIDVLVNNAGYLIAGAVEEVSIEEAKAQFETNFFGVARMLRAVLPHMRERRSGHLITISSLAGLVPVPFWGYYNASKFAVEGLVETLRFETRPFGIKVALVEPGAIKTPFYAQPQATKMADYARWRDAALGSMAKFEAKAPGPEVVANLVARIARSNNPRLRNRLTTEATMFSFLRWLLPAGAFAAGVRRGFGINFR